MPSNDLTRILDSREYQVVRIDEEADENVTLFIEPRAPHPVCPKCDQGFLFVYSTEKRTVRHLDAFHRRCFLRFEVRFVRCPRYSLPAEVNELVESRKRSTKAFRRYIGSRCKLLQNSQVADHLGLSADTVRRIDKEYQQESYPPPDFMQLRRLAIDETAYRMGHNYLTVVLNYDNGEVPVMKVARTLQRHRQGLLAHHIHRMTNDPLEGLNTKINALRRSRYGFRDLVYFGLKIKQFSIERSPRQVLRPTRAAA